ncbi:MAG: Gfo/Idh/MocA family protein [Paracoccaceae bacterium]
MQEPRIAVVGAGLIGRKHVEMVRREAHLAAVVDPSEAAKALANAIGAEWYSDLPAYLADHRPDGAIVATPNRMHADHALACIAAGVPVLIEKPVADNAGDAEKLVSAAEAAGVPVLVGHHRRYNPIVTVAREAIASGRLGDIVSVHAQFWLFKPEDYFDVAWRRRKGAGPVFINLIHDMDLLRFLCGEIVSVQAVESRAARGFHVEDTAAILLEFANGALGTVAVSDAVVAPWSWELTAAENAAYPATGAACYMFGGSRASLSLPDLQLWQYPGERGWHEAIGRTVLAHNRADPLVLQMRHFLDVTRGRSRPMVSGREGLASLRVVEAVKRAAAAGTAVSP